MRRRLPPVPRNASARFSSAMSGDIGLDLRDFLQAGLVSLAIDRQGGDALRLPLVDGHHVASDPDLVALVRFRDSEPFSFVGPRDGHTEGVEIFALGQLHERQPVVLGEQDGLLIAADRVSVEVRREPPEHRVRREVHGLLELIAVVRVPVRRTSGA